jgi:hypothetical protein
VARRIVILLGIIFLLLLGSFTIAIAQDSPDSLAALSSTEINFYGKEGTLPKSRNLIIVGLADGVQVTLVASDLYCNTSDVNITVKFNHTGPVLVSKNVSKAVEISLGSTAKAGIYKGSIIVTATANENITATNLAVVATITALNPWFSSVVQWGLIILIGFLIFVALTYPYDWKLYFDRRRRSFSKTGGSEILSKEILLVGVGVTVSILWLWSLVSFPFGDPSTVITTILISPFLAYAIGIVKDKRTERLEKEKASRTLRDEGIKKDIELVTSLIGEIGTHFSSFKPNYYEEKAGKKPEYTPSLLYQATGLLSSDVWAKSCRQGFVADIHTLHLEKYYDLIPLYNQYYTRAITLVKEGKFKTCQKEFFKPFERCREKYGALETVLFIYLSYILELYSKTSLTPLKLEHPRITRTLLKKLIDYRILKPFECIDMIRSFGKKELAINLVGLRKLSARVLKERLPGWKDSEVRELKGILLSIEGSEEKLEKEFSKLVTESTELSRKKAGWREEYKAKNPGLINDKKQFNKGFKEYAEACAGEYGISEDKFRKLEVLEKWVKMRFKEKIEWWKFTANDLQKIVELIYAKDVVPDFLRHVQDDFYDKYLKLKQCIKELPPVHTFHQRTLDSECK